MRLLKQSHHWQASNDVNLESGWQMGRVNINAKHSFTAYLFYHHTFTAIEALNDHLNILLADASDLLFGKFCVNSFIDYPSSHLMCIIAYKEQQS